MPQEVVQTERRTSRRGKVLLAVWAGAIIAALAVFFSLLPFWHRPLFPRYLPDRWRQKDSHLPHVPPGAFTAGKDTTVLFGPYRADGTINYSAALGQQAQAGVNPTNNAAVILMRATGLNSLGPQTWLHWSIGVNGQHVYKPLFTRTTAFAKARHAATLTGAALRILESKPWQPATNPTAAAWIAANKKPLDWACLAAKRPRYYAPAYSFVGRQLIQTTLAPLNWRTVPIGQALIARAMLEAGQKHYARAINDLLAVHRLARLLCQTPLVPAQLAAYRLDLAACRADEALLRVAAVPPPAMLAMARAWVSMAPWAVPANTFNHATRYSCLDVTMLLALRWYRLAVHVMLGRPHRPFNRPQLRWVKSNLRLLKAAEPIMRDVNAKFDQLHVWLTTGTLASQTAALHKCVVAVRMWRKQFLAMATEHRGPEYTPKIWMLALRPKQMEAAWDAFAQAKCRDSAMRLAAVAAAYAGQNHAFATRMSRLKTYLQADLKIPVARAGALLSNPFDGHPWHYAATKTGCRISGTVNGKMIVLQVGG